MGLLNAGYQRILIVDFDGFLPVFYHPQLPPLMPTWPYATAWIIEAGSEWQCKTQRCEVGEESELPQSLLFLQHYLQNTSTFTIPGERAQWQWCRS